jgi:hypothetical protein
MKKETHERSYGDWVELTTFSSLIDAEIAKSRLEADSIPAIIRKDDYGGMSPALQLTLGVHLFVPRSRFKTARRSLGLS